MKRSLIAILQLLTLLTQLFVILENQMSLYVTITDREVEEPNKIVPQYDSVKSNPLLEKPAIAELEIVIAVEIVVV